MFKANGKLNLCTKCESGNCISEEHDISCSCKRNSIDGKKCEVCNCKTVNNTVPSPFKATGKL